MSFIRSLIAGFLWLSLALAFSACSWQKKEQDLRNGDRVLVQVPFSLNGEYSLRIVELFTLVDVPQLQGLAARFLIDPDSTSGQLQGRLPRIRYIRNQDGVIVPKDDLSLQLLTLYAHMEKLRNLDIAAGAGEVTVWPATIAVNAQYQDQKGSAVDNALYSPKFDALLVVPYTLNALPLMANGGVIGHEHFHNLFQRLVVAPLQDLYPMPQATVHNEARLEEAMGLQATGPTKTDNSKNIDKQLEDQVKQKRTLYHSVVLRGLNEGLADVWGWIFSGDSDLVGRSLPSQRIRRKMDLSLTEMSSEKDLRERPENVDPYDIGSEVAKAFRHLADEMAQARGLKLTEVRMLMAQWVIAMLPELEKKFAALKDDQYLAPSDVLMLFSAQMKEQKASECAFLAQLIPETDRKKDLSSHCEALTKQENP